MRCMGIVDFLFGCHHSNLSRIFTIDGHTYRVCCDCGTKFDYSLETMSVERRDAPDPAPALSLATSLRSAD